MRKSLVLLLASLTLALGLCPAFAFAADLQGGGALDVQDVDTVKVTFNTGVGPEIAEANVQIGESLTDSTAAEALATYAGYTADAPLVVGESQYKLVGWYTDADFTATKEFDVDTDAVSKDMTLYAKLSKKCTITYDYNYADAPDAATVEAWQYDTLTAPVIPADVISDRADYDFDAWYTDKDTMETKWVFEGDAEEPTEVADDTTLYAKWNAIYTVKFDANYKDADVAMDDQVMVQGTKENLTAVPDTFTRAGYTFAKWNTAKDGSGTAYDDGAEVVDLSTVGGDTVTLYAQWAGNDYAVNFQANDGQGTMGTQNMVYGETKLAKNTFTREGFTFVGWATAKPAEYLPSDATDAEIAEAVDFEDEAIPTFDSVAPNETKSLWAVWKINKYKLTYDANGGTVNDGTDDVATWTREVDFNSLLADYAVDTASRENYNFSGWDTELPDNMPANDLTIKAKWAGDDCTVYFVMNGHGGTIEPQTVAYGSLATEPTLASAEGVEFDGWFVGEWDAYDEQVYCDWKTPFYFNEPITQSAVYVCAKWKVATHEVTFNLNGGSWPAAKSNVMNPQIIEYGNGAYYPFVLVSEDPDEDGDVWNHIDYTKVEPYRLGYGFAGWFSDEACTQAVVLNEIEKDSWWSDPDDISSINGVADSGTKILKDTTLYAKWDKLSYQVKFVESDGTVSVVDKDGKKFDQTVEYGEKATEPVDPVGPTGKTIDGWFTAYAPTTDTYTGLYDFSQPVYGNKKLYAKWTDGVYTVAYNANGGKGEMADQEITYDDSTTAQGTKLTKNAFTRDGYLFGGWTTINDATVTTVADEAALQDLVAAIGTGDYQSELYFLDEALITTQITKGTTLYAIWVGPQTYDVKFDGNGATTGIMTDMTGDNGITYGDAAKTLPANKFDRDGYVFTGWNTKADGTGTAYKNRAKVKDLTEDTTLYAQWAEAVNVTFMQNASATDTAKATQKVKKGGATELDAFSTLKSDDDDTPFANGAKAFKGWNTKADGTGDAYADMAEITVDADTTLYAQWATSAVVTFTNKAETTVFDTVTVDLTKTDKSVYYTKSVPTQAGDDEYDVYTFQYWTLKGDAASKPTQYTTKSDGQVVSGAGQTPYIPAYDTTFIANFQGASYVVQSDGSVKLVENQQKTHTVLYVVNGAVVKVDSEVAYGAKLTVPNDSYTQVDGYTFTGKWLKDDGKAFNFESDTVKTDLTLTAEMTENEASDEQKAEADAALATAAELLAGDNLTDEEKAALQSAVDAYNALDPKTPSGIEALKAAVETAKAAADASQTKKDAAAATAAADEFLAGAEVSADGSDVATDKDWVTEAQKKAIEDAAKAVKDAGDAVTADQVKALNDAVAAAKANGKGKDASKAAATDAEKAEGDKALADAKALQDDVKAGKKTLADADAKALQDAIDAYNAKKAAGTLTSGDVAALKAAVEKAQKAAKAAPAPVAKKMKVDQKVKKIKATKGKKTVTKNVFAVSDAQGTVKVTVAKKFKKFVKAKANGKVIVTKKAKKGGKVAITITDGKTKQTIKVKVKLAKKK